MGRFTAIDFPVLAPDQPLFVIGDVHGCATLLTQLLDRAPNGALVICVGDLVDRGDNSKAVIDLLMSRHDVICLRGNHEDMLLAFLDDPQGRPKRWLQHGGLQTLASFGIAQGTSRDQRDALFDALGPDRMAWLHDRPHLYQSGNVAVVHAGADPSRPLDTQASDNLVWGHPAFGKTPRVDGTWVVHGHTIVPEPMIQNGVISVDTGAYATGRLTAAFITQGNCAFIQENPL